MELQVALIISVVLQFGAFVITISLIPKTRFNFAWISISIGFLLMALRRMIEVFYIFKTDELTNISIVSSWIAVVISVAIFLASIYIRRIFEVLNRIGRLRKENQARLLSAVISTEERERKHFAKELHDGLGPVLSSAKMTLSAIDKDGSGSTNSDLLDRAEYLVDNAIRTAKEISGRLTPHILERYGLKKAVDTFIKHTIDPILTKVMFSTNIGKQRFHLPVEVIVYRICCELITNSLKHARADHISLLMTGTQSAIQLKYDDDGQGCLIENCQAKGMGLTNIISRVKSVNGTIELKSSPDKGFYASIKLPL